MQRERADVLLVRRRKYKKYSKQRMTYLGLIAYAIQNSPEKKLMFCEIMNAVGIFVNGDKKGIENNIRVCLSSNRCFVKVPTNPKCPNAKRNFWKMDFKEITPNILRRHFGGLRDVSPAFYENMAKQTAKNTTKNSATAKRLETQKKFSSSFSIESLLKRESSVTVWPHCANRNAENESLSSTEDRTRKTFDTQYAYCQTYSHFSFPAHHFGQMNYGYSSCSGPSKRMCYFSELAYRQNCT